MPVRRSTGSTARAPGTRASNRTDSSPSVLEFPYGANWRCTCCNKLLGVFRDGRVHLRFSRGHEYLVSLPAQATCRGCGTLNEAPAPTR